MKKYFSILLIFLSFQAVAQLSDSFLPPINKSPMDMSYYPDNYPILKIQGKATEPLTMRVIYSRPQINSRKIFGDLQPYGNVCSLGANEATEIEFFKDVRVNGKKIKKGRYTLYAVPYTDEWTLIINKETDTWGSFRYDSTKDVVRMDLPGKKNEITQAMTVVFTKSNDGALMDMYWEDVKVSLPIVF
jgi:hypothetical protein